VNRFATSITGALISVAAIAGMSVVGVSQASAAVSVPAAPRAVKVAVAKNVATVSWLKPLDSGEAPILRYGVRCVSTNGGVTRTAGQVAGSPAKVTQLSWAKRYHCAVQAVNRRGAGAKGWSAYFVTPRKPVTTPTAAVTLDCANGATGDLRNYPTSASHTVFMFLFHDGDFSSAIEPFTGSWHGALPMADYWTKTGKFDVYISVDSPPGADTSLAHKSVTCG
jgi:hypothetical protein